MHGETSDTLLFQQCGLRPTRQRIAVLVALRSVKSHPTAEDLHRIVLENDGSMSLATVYNTLQALCESGLCRKVPTTDQSCRYDAGVHDHVHLRDATSGRILDIPEDLSRRLLACIPPALIAEIGEHVGADTMRVSVQLVGDCEPAVASVTDTSSRS